MKETIFRKILPIILIILCLTFVKIDILEYILLALLGYYLYRFVKYIWMLNKSRNKLGVSKALKSEFCMMIFAFCFFISSLLFITHGYSPWFIWGLFCFGGFMIFTVCKHMLRYNKQELIVFQNQLELKISMWIVSKLGNN